MQLKVICLVTLAFVSLISSVQSSAQVLLKNRNGVTLAEVTEHPTGQLIIKGEYLHLGITVPPNPIVSIYLASFESDSSKLYDAIYAYVWIRDDCLQIFTDFSAQTYAVDLTTLRHGPSTFGCFSVH